MFRWVGGLIDRVFGLAGALLFSQMPLFMQQYQQQLMGHVSELRVQVDAMTKAAALSGKSLQQYILKFLNSEDVDFIHQGELMNQMVSRYEGLLKGSTSLQEASIYDRPFYFIKYLDMDIAKSTFNSFEFGFAFSVESVAYAALGLGFGLLAFWLLSKVVKSIFHTLSFKKEIKA